MLDYLVPLPKTICDRRFVYENKGNEQVRSPAILGCIARPFPNSGDSINRKEKQPCIRKNGESFRGRTNFECGGRRVDSTADPRALSRWIEHWQWAVDSECSAGFDCSTVQSGHAEIDPLVSISSVGTILPKNQSNELWARPSSGQSVVGNGVPCRWFSIAWVID